MGDYVLGNAFTVTQPLEYDVLGSADVNNWTTITSIEDLSDIEVKFLVYDNSNVLESYLNADLWSDNYYAQKTA